jgi:hypothetical protein
MKTKAACFSLLATIAALWGTWLIAYQRGYSQGSRDEFACWKKGPMSSDQEGIERIITGRRDMWTFPGGKPFPARRIFILGEPKVNKIPSTITP